MKRHLLNKRRHYRRKTFNAQINYVRKAAEPIILAEGAR